MNSLNLIFQIENNIFQYDSNLVDVKFVVPQVSVGSPLLFLVYIMI